MSKIKKNPDLEIDVKKVGLFIKNLTKAEFLYTRNIMAICYNIRNLIETFKLEKDFVCKKFRIKPPQYDDFVGGNIDYSMMHIACYEALHVELESDPDYLAKRAQMITIPKNTETKSS